MRPLCAATQRLRRIALAHGMNSSPSSLYQAQGPLVPDGEGGREYSQTLVVENMRALEARGTRKVSSSAPLKAALTLGWRLI